MWHNPSVIDEQNPDGVIDMNFALYGTYSFEYNWFEKTIPYFGEWGAHNKRYELLQDEKVSLDLLGANIVRGIKRAQHEGLRPSIVNVGSWHNRGRVDPDTYDGSTISYTLGIFEQLNAVAPILGANSIQAEDPDNPRILYSSRKEFEFIRQVACSTSLVINEKCN
ncbi:hypothetical protein HC928_09820 [bacterium]|nr:hypothetical protein [bacterium]